LGVQRDLRVPARTHSELIIAIAANLPGHAPTADPRHHDIVAMSKGEETRERIYPHWEMEQVEADDIREVLHDALDAAHDPNNIAALNRILEQLHHGSLRAFGIE
jgi:hypothetical protein